MWPPRLLRLALALPLLLGAHAFSNPWEALPPAFDADGMCPQGPVGDAMCDSEAVERANSEQLHSILQEITNATFFRLWRVDLHAVCPFERFASDTLSCAPVAVAETSTAPFLDEKLKGVFEPTAVAASSCSVEAHPELSFEASDLTTDLVDTTISRAEDEAADMQSTTAPCDDEELPQFWLDMCARIPTSSGQVVNLRLNPESDTGYNGSEIWASMYQENCFVRASQPSSMCLEERVLYRLLSGMHASTNLHVAMHHNSSHSLHSGPVAIFLRHFSNEKAERLRDLHFAFVVLLRAVQKGSDFIRAYPFHVGVSADEGKRTTALVHRLLDSCILQSCASVFSAFDEAMLFQKPHEHTWWSLKRQFKGVFQNISKIVDCVPCQKCRLHGKLQLLGLGTALKWLLLPADLIQTTTSREELVALVNTLSKFSRAIAWARQLSARAFTEKAAAAEKAAAVTARQSDQRPSGSAHPLSDAVRMIASLARDSQISSEQEMTLLRLALSNDPAITSLVEHYGDDASRYFSLVADARGRSFVGSSPAIAVGSTL